MQSLTYLELSLNSLINHAVTWQEVSQYHVASMKRSHSVSSRGIIIKMCTSFSFSSKIDCHRPSFHILPPCIYSSPDENQPTRTQTASATNPQPLPKPEQPAVLSPSLAQRICRPQHEDDPTDRTP